MTPAIVPPPWQLTGRGYVLLLFPRIGDTPSGSRHSGLDPRTIPRVGGFGVLMLLDYTSSNAGPYRELLYIPGRVSIRVPRRMRGHSISRIFVTTEISRTSGEENWGIPKLLGTITWGTDADATDEACISDSAGRPVLTVTLPPGRRRKSDHRPLSLPFSHRFLPRTLLQTSRGVLYSTTIEAAGRFRPIVGVRLSGYGPIGEEIAARRIAASFFLPEVHLSFPPATNRLPVNQPSSPR